MKLLVSAVTKYVLGSVLVGAMLFIPNGGFDYPNGWLFLGLLFIPMLVVGSVLFVKAPKLLEKRLDSKETENTQKAVVAVSAICFITGFTVAGLDHRFEWSDVPTWAVVMASVILLLAYAVYAEVMRENAYISRTVKVSKGQTVVDTGLYGIIRHPMYAATLWLFLSIPAVLGSLWAFICFLPYPIVIVIRILNEERILKAELCGYSEYMKRVKYRLIPFIW